jgi:hypothetical protein
MTAMPNYLVDPAIWKALWPLLLFPLGSAACICLALRAKPYCACLPTVFALSLLGIVTGQVTGFSRVSAVGTVLPAVLSLLGGMMLYLLGTKGKHLQASVVMGVIGLSINLLVGIYWGARSRADYEARATSPDVLARHAVAKENARYTAAVQKLLNDQEYAKLKAGIESAEPK